MFKIRNIRSTNVSPDSLLSSSLVDQDSFYKKFTEDLNKAKKQVIIESPFITYRRMSILFPVFQKLRKQGVKIIINTKPLHEQEPAYYMQADEAISALQQLGVLVLFTGGHHRKLAIIDKQIVWEGSLNILSQNDSCEIMRRIFSEQLANQMLSFLHLEKFTGVM